MKHLSGLKLKSLLNLIKKSISARHLINHSATLTNNTTSKHFFSSNYSLYTNNKYKVDLDYDFFCDHSNTDHIKENIKQRNCGGDIDKVISLWTLLKYKPLTAEERKLAEQELEQEALKIPNKCSPHIFKYGNDPYVLKTYNEKPSFNFKPKEFHDLVEHLNLLNRSRHLALGAGIKSYALEGPLADLERALVR